MNCDPDTLTRGEQAIITLLTRHRRLTGRQIADALDSTPNSVKVIICRLRSKGISIKGGGHGLNSLGYKLEGIR